MTNTKFLNQKHLIAMEKRMQGCRYQEIAKEVGVSIDTIKTWFRKNGLLQMHYGDYARYVYEKFYQNARAGTMNSELVRNILADKAKPVITDKCSKPQ